MHVFELKRDLTPREAEIWEGRSGLPAGQEEQYRQLWRRLAAGEPARPRTDSSCAHFGPDTGRQVETLCGSCGDASRLVRLNVFACDVHGACTPGTKVAGVACCKGCQERKPRPPAPRPSEPAGVVTDESDEPFAGRSHLVYHLLPVAGNGIWQWNVDELRRRWHLFDGRKIVAVGTGPKFSRGAGQLETEQRWALDPVDAVRSYLPPDAEVVEFVNDPRLREVVSWHSLWGAVLGTAAPEDRVLYAHAKGVTRSSSLVSRWSELMYSILLDHPRLLASALAKYPIAGCFRKVGRCFSGSESAWHYSGSFFWVRVGAMLGRRWPIVDVHWWGNEAWPGTAFEVHEAGVLFKSAPQARLDMFSPTTWPGIEEQYAEWLRVHPVEITAEVAS